MNVLIALAGGILTFISPCVLPLIPVYLAYITGVSFRDMSDPAVKKPYRRIIASSVLFVLGFSLVFTLLAALFYIFARSLGTYKIWFDRVAGLVLIIFGLNMAGVLKIGFLNFEVKYKKEIGKKNFLSPFLIGVAFGAGWTPCVGPILSGILFTSAQGSVWNSVILLLVYSLGLGIPFLLTGLLTGRLLSVFAFVKKHYRAVEIIGGVFLMLLGLLLIFNGVGWLSGFFSRLLPGLANLETGLVK